MNAEPQLAKKRVGDRGNGVVGGPFDSQRAMAECEALSLAADVDAKIERVETAFAAAGLDVSRTRIPGSRIPGMVGPWITGIGFIVLIAGFMGALILGASRELCFALFVSSLAWYGLGFNDDWLWRFLGSPRGRANLITATTSEFESVAPIARVAFLSPLDRSSRPQKAGQVIGWLIFAVGMLFVTGPSASNSELYASYVTTLTIAVAISATLMVGILVRDKSPGTGTNRFDPGNASGLAILLELARNRIRNCAPCAMVFAATDDAGLMNAGLRELSRRLRSQSPTLPTLYVILDAPGTGALWTLGYECDQRILVDALANVLWSVEIVEGRPSTWMAPRPLHRSRLESVTLLGGVRDAEERMRSNLPAIATETLAAAADLVQRIALGWARSNSIQVQSPGSSPTPVVAKSDQNSG